MFYRCVDTLRSLIERNHPSVMRLFAPYQEKGIIDTIKLFLPLGITRTEVRQFSDTKHWKPYWYPDDRIKFYLNRQSFIRVRPHDYSVSVEGEIPKILGAPSNEHVSGMTRQNVREAIKVITAELLPITCAIASEKGIEWRATRLDLAVNFMANHAWPELADHLPDLRWPRVRDAAQRYNNDRPSIRGIEWGKKPYTEEEKQERRENGKRITRVPRWRMSVYSKTTKQMQTGLRTVLPASHTWRAELQYHQAACLRHLADMSPEGRDLVIGESPSRTAIAIDYQIMHAAHFLALLELKPPVHGNTALNLHVHYSLIEKCYPGILWSGLLIASDHMERQAQRMKRRLA
jgi:hypothetical protein